MMNDVDLEEGELSCSGDEEIYIPLQRPAATSTAAAAATTNTEKSPCRLASSHQHIHNTLGGDESQTNTESSSGESSEDDCIKKLRTDGSNPSGQRKRKKRIRRTVMVRVPPSESEMQPNRARFRKYNVWTAALQEEALSENMRGCDVTQTGNDRNVENYDFPFKYKLNGENVLKRRLSDSSDEESSHPVHKRKRRTTTENQRRPITSRLGYHSRRGNSSTSGTSDSSCEPRNIFDLEDTIGREPADVAREMANKLYEEKDELLVRVIEVLGMTLPMEIYKETQRIEADGGMMVKTGKRRRTPGGVFLFLLKHHDKITPEQQKVIFAEDRQQLSKNRKQIETLMRDRKVEELKKCLSERGNDLPTLLNRKDIYTPGPESLPGNLSNPPPSPVGREQSSPEYKSHEININHVDNSDIPTTSKAALELKELVSYDDDFLDVNCGEMDFF